MAAHTEVAISAATLEAVHQQGNQELHEGSYDSGSALIVSCFRVVAIVFQGFHASREKAAFAVASSSVGAKTDAALVKCIVQVSTCT